MNTILEVDYKKYLLKLELSKDILLSLLSDIGDTNSIYLEIPYNQVMMNESEGLQRFNIFDEIG